MTVRGIVYDSLHSRPLSGAFVSIGARSAISDSLGSFALTEIAPGTYRVAAQHDEIDRLGLSAIGASVTVTDGRELVSLSLPSFAGFWRLECGQAAPPADTGFVFGTVRPARAGTTVSASWIDIAARGTSISQKMRTLEVVTDARGNFALCGVPTTTGLTIHASSDSLASGAFDLGPLDQERVLRRDLTLLDPAAAPRARYIGKVLADSGKPVAGAEVSIPELGLSLVTGVNGEFRLDSVTPGSRRILVRKIGYAETQSIEDFQSGERLTREIVMERITTLDSVSVTAKPLARDEAMRAFEEHRRMGLGKFITAAELAKQRGAKLSSLVLQFPSLLYDFRTGLVSSKRGIKSTRQATCLIPIYLDGILQNRGAVQGRSAIGDLKIDDFPPDILAGLEYFPGGASVPIEYARLNHDCGVILLHSRYKTKKH